MFKEFLEELRKFVLEWTEFVGYCEVRRDSRFNKDFIYRDKMPSTDYCNICGYYGCQCQDKEIE